MSWLPLESNPEVMNKYLHNLGVPEKWQMVDVYGLDPDLLATVPRPVLAVLLLFPCTDKVSTRITFVWLPSHMGVAGNELADVAKEAVALPPLPCKVSASDVLSQLKHLVMSHWAQASPLPNKLRAIKGTIKYDEHKALQEAEINEKGQSVSDNVYYLKQAVTNACGTIALIHSVANNADQIQLGDGHLKQFLDDSMALTPEERGELLQKAEGIINTHKELAMEGQTEAPESDEPVNFHFVAFIEKDGTLYELDGRKAFPINHGKTAGNTLLEDAAKVCQAYMKRDPDELHFTVVALTAAA